ncbi:MAG: hypothetical protein WBL53_09560 [Pseudonocardiaceae bacterium]
MSDSMSFTEIESQDVQLLPARTVLSLFVSSGGRGAGGGGGGGGGDHHGGGGGGGAFLGSVGNHDANHSGGINVTGGNGGDGK